MENNEKLYMDIKNDEMLVINICFVNSRNDIKSISMCISKIINYISACKLSIDIITVMNMINEIQYVGTTL